MNYRKIICAALALFTAAAFSGCSLLGGEEKPSFSATPEPTPIAEESTDNTQNSSFSEKKEKIELTPVPTVVDTDMTSVTTDVSDYLKDNFDEFKSLAKCLNAGETSFDFSNDDNKAKILGCVSSLPVSDYLNIENGSVSYLVSSSEIKSNISDIDNFFQAFATENSVNKNMTDFEKTALVYKYVSSFTFDDGTDEMLKTMQYKSGSDLASARIFTWFLNQLGVECRLISCNLTDDSLHYFAAVKIDGKYYAFDPVLENQKNGGSGLDYFMMSSSRAQTVGLGAVFRSGRDAYFSSEFSLSVDTSKDSLFGDTTLWNLDSEAHILYLCKDGDNYGEYSLSFNTVTLSEIQG